MRTIHLYLATTVGIRDEEYGLNCVGRQHITVLSMIPNSKWNFKNILRGRIIFVARDWPWCFCCGSRSWFWTPRCWVFSSADLDRFLQELFSWIYSTTCSSPCSSVITRFTRYISSHKIHAWLYEFEL